MAVNESKVVIRCALQTFEDFPVICPLEWSVRRLKEHLRDVCNDHPNPDRQRLIYAGQCLDDAKTLAAVLRHYTDSEAQVIHLVYPPSINKIKQQKQQNDKISDGNLRQRKNANLGQGNVSNSPTNTTNSGNTSTNQHTSYYPLTPPSTPLQWQQAQQQVYQAYVASYANYMQHMYNSMAGNVPTPPMGLGFGPGTGLVGAQPFVFGGPYSPQISPYFDNNNINNNNNTNYLNNIHQSNNVLAQQAPQQQVEQPVPQQQAPPQPVAMNAQGGFLAGEEEGARDRDWLDGVYTAIRAGLMLMIIYFYSTSSRLIFAVLAFLVVQLFRWRRNINNQNQNQNQNPQPRAENGNNGQGQEGAANAEENAASNIVNGMAPGTANDPFQLQQMSPWTIFWSTCYTFISSFFTSLIPENPPPIDIN